MLGYDQVDTLAERFLGRIAKQRRTGGVPANYRSRVVDADDSISDLIENPLGQFGLLFHGWTALDWNSRQPRSSDRFAWLERSVQTRSRPAIDERPIHEHRKRADSDAEDYVSGHPNPDQGLHDRALHEFGRAGVDIAVSRTRIGLPHALRQQ